MEREEFLKSLGLGLTLVCTGSCFSACGKDDGDNKPNSGNKVTVDLSTQLSAVGSQTASNGILIFRIAAGNLPSSFVATQKLCPHEGGNLNWVQADSKIVCDKHAAKFAANGSILAQPSSAGTIKDPLKVYPVTITGNTLTVTT